MRITPGILLLALISLLSARVQAGRYPVTGTQTFTLPNGTPTFTDGSVLLGSSISTKINNNRLQMQTSPFTGNPTAWKLPSLDGTSGVESFDATFTVGLSKSFASTIPSAGFALSYGPIPASGNGSGDLGYTMANGIVISFDTFADTVNDFPSIEVYCNNSSVGNFFSTSFAQTLSITGGTFTLANPATGGTTGNIAYNATAATVQTAMRAVSGWSTVTVTGSAGAWTINRGVVGNYADPTGNGASLTGPTAMTPGLGRVVITNTQDGGATANEIWTIGLVGRGYIYDGVQRTVVAHWDYNGLDLTYNGQVIFTDLPTPGFSPAGNYQFAFTSSTAGAGVHETFLDDVVVSTTPAGPSNTGLIISEFMAENASSLEDEDVDAPDWIEIYNGQNAAVNLLGYRLTNGSTTWTFPSVPMSAYGHLVVFASGKDRTANPALLHTNFTLPKTGGTVSLLNPASAVISSWTYPNQTEDVSYGLKYQGGASGFINTPSPGAGTLYSYIVASNGPAEDVVWSREGGVITGSTPIGINAPAAPGSVVRYTLDNSQPNGASPLYSGPFTISSSTNIRARVFTSGYLPGPVSSRTLLLIDASLATYNGTGAPFQSNVPIVVFDSFGLNVDGENGATRPARYTYAVVIDKDPLTGRALITGAPDFQGRSGTHVHGESSAGFAQRSYNWEIWDNNDADKNAGVLGMPAGSDWVLHGPFSDKAAMRNHLMYSMTRAMRPDWLAPRTRQVEVFYNQEAGQPVSYADYRGIYTLIEKISRGKNRVDIAKLNEKVTNPALLTGGYIFKRDKTDPGASAWTTSAPFNIGMQSHKPGIFTAPQLSTLSTYINNFQAVLNGANFADPVTGYTAWMDVSSFIDQQLAVELSKQIDGYVFSTYWHKDRSGKIRAGPLWDFNIALGNANYAEGQRPDGWNYDAVGANSGGFGGLWYPRLHADPAYRLRTFDRYWEWRRSVLTNAAFAARVNSEAAVLGDGGDLTLITNNSPLSVQSPAARHFRKYSPPFLNPALMGGDYWPNPPGFASRLTYQSEIDYLINWMTTRLTWMDDQFTSGGVVLRPPVFSVAGGDVLAGTSLTITSFTGTPPAGFSYATGTIYYTTDGSDPTSGSGTVTESTLIAGSGAACKWLVPAAGNGGLTLTADSGAEQWTTYTDPPNIANWTAATTGIGYDTNPDYLSLLGTNGNTGSQMNGINATCYLRLTFNIPDQATLNNIGSLKLAMKYDDGFRAYINGVVVAGRNDSDPSMTSNPATAQANVIHDDAAAIVFEDIDISGTGIPALRIGTNVLAIHCLNLPSASSDLLFIPKLTYFPPGAAPGGGQVYTGPLTLNATTTIRARLRTASGAWTPLTTATYTIDTVPASATNLVISEMNYNPANPSAAESAAGFLQASVFEYIELQNINPAQTVDLTGVSFTEGINFNFNDGDPTAIALVPGGRVLLVANVTAYTMRYGPPPAGVKIAGTWQGSLANGGEQLRLADQLGGTIRDFFYDNNEPWPVAADGLGYSLVLNNPSLNPNHGIAANWRASATIGGSPGLANNIPFTGSPGGDTDGDGYSDFLEYATGSNLNSTTSRNAPALGFATYTVGGIPGTYLRFTFTRALNADGFTLTPELTTDLISWNSTIAAITYVGSIPNGDGTATTEYRSTQPSSDLGSRVLMRLRVTPSP